MLTADTHFPVGYICDLCGDTQEDEIENVVLCADQQISGFIHWIQQQDFYENTTIVLLADHFYMSHDYIEDNNIIDSSRTLFHCIINPKLSTDSVTQREWFQIWTFFPLL